jgi:hypothetical protein
MWYVFVLFVFLRLVYHMMPVSLDCPFLIAPSVFSNVYLGQLYWDIFHILSMLCIHVVTFNVCEQCLKTAKWVTIKWRMDRR